MMKHALLVSSNSAASYAPGQMGIEELFFDANYLLDIVTPPAAFAPNLQIDQVNFMASSPDGKSLYVRGLPFAGAIFEIDVATGMFKTFVTKSSGGRNFVVDNAGSVYWFDLFGNIRVASPPFFVSAIFAPPVNFAPNGITAGSRTLAFNPHNNHIGLLLDDGGSYWPVEQGIGHFGPNGAFLGELLPWGSYNSIITFVFGGSGDIYAAKLFGAGSGPASIGEGGIDKYNGVTGALEGTFISGAQLKGGPLGNMSGPVRNMLFAPDGSSMIVSLGNGVAEISLAGVKERAVPTAFPNPGALAAIALPDPPIKPPPPFRSIRDSYPALETQMLLRIVVGPSGPTLPGQAPSPEGSVGASLSWASLNDHERDAVVAYGLHQLSRVMSEQKTANDIQRAVVAALSRDSRGLLENLIAARGAQSA